VRFDLIASEINDVYLLREKSAHITKAARSATLANLLVPMLCIPMFKDEVPMNDLAIWLGYMLVAITLRTWMIFRLEQEAEDIVDPQHNLKVMAYALGIVGVGWGLGWIFIAPQLGLVNHMIYIYGTTAAMIASMFAYSVHKAAFYAFNIPIMLPSLVTVLVGANSFTWPFSVGLASLYIVVFSIANNFGKTFENSIKLRFRNERLYQELATERDQSIAANVAKSKFIAVASHDLRQPMHAVNVYLDLVNLDNLPAAEQKSLTKIKNSITTLNAMFDSLLNISKLDADAMPMNPRVFRLDELATTICDLAEAKASSKGLLLRMSHPDLLVRGDKLMLQQIISNLVSNAIQYTERGQVDVRFESEQDCLTIHVSDTGCGIAESEQQNIFQQFYRADNTRALHDGLGLGLSIVQRLCNLIGADIRVISTPRQGSTFTVTTPFPILASAEDMYVAQHVTPKLHDAHRSLQGKCIAVIEDNPIIVEAYRQTLASKGAYVQVLSEFAGELDVQLATIDRIDCILSDFRLSQTTGDVLIQKLRDNYNEEIPAIIVTADTSPAHINLFDQLNVQVLHKPISFHDVALAIEKLIAFQ
jgi:signal transduction histidine kinase